MPKQELHSRRCKLRSVEINAHGDRTNLRVTLGGHEMALAQAQQAIGSVLGHAFVEHDASQNALTIVTPLERATDSAMQQAAAAVEKIWAATGCRLSGVYMQPDFDQIGDGSKAIYTPAITVRCTEQAQDPDNLAGRITLDIIRNSLQKTSALQHYIADPHAPEGESRLMRVNQGLETDTEALSAAEAAIRDAEKEYGLFDNKPALLRLVALRTGAVDNPKGGDDLYLASARLKGTDEALDTAFRKLRRRHRNRIAKLAEGDGFLDVGTGGTEPVDPTNLLAAVHMTTDCEIPVQLKPFAHRSKQPPYAYEPGIETRVTGDESGLQQITLRHAAARYAGSFIPGKNYSVPEEMDPHEPSRVIVHQPHYTEEDALSAAGELTQRIQSRLHNGHGQGQRRAS